MFVGNLLNKMLLLSHAKRIYYIADKVKENGYSSLSAEEKKFINDMFFIAMETGELKS